MGDPTEPLAAVRRDEIVVVRPTLEAEAPAVAAALGTARDRMADRKLPLAVGVSTVHAGLADVPAGYNEACLAVEQLRERGGVLALGGLAVADYLILRAGDATAWRLVPHAVRSFLAEDARQGSVLSDTLLAYVASDLSVKLAAERLFVHPNTAHYRLSKIEERTGCSIRRLADVLLLAIAVRLQREHGG
jgi:DNA-binding PucR family transcriptional regulator